MDREREIRRVTLLMGIGVLLALLGIAQIVIRAVTPGDVALVVFGSIQAVYGIGLAGISIRQRRRLERGPQ